MVPFSRGKRKSQDRENDGKHPLSHATLEMRLLGLLCLTNCSLHKDACFPNVSFNQHIFSLTFVKPLLLLRVTLSAFKMACGSYLPSLTEMWKVWVTPFHKESCQGSWLQSDIVWGKKKKPTFWKLKWWLFYYNSASQK